MICVLYFLLKTNQQKNTRYNHSNYISKCKSVKDLLGSRIKLYSPDQISYVLYLITTTNKHNYKNNSDIDIDIAIGSDVIKVICDYIGTVCGVECSYCKNLVPIQDESDQFAAKIKDVWEDGQKHIIFCTNCAMKSNKDFFVVPQNHYGDAIPYGPRPW